MQPERIVREQHFPPAERNAPCQACGTRISQSAAAGVWICWGCYQDIKRDAQ